MYKNRFTKWMSEFLLKKIYADILQYVKNHQEKYAGQNYPPSKLPLISVLKQHYNEKQIHEAVEYLCSAGYLKDQENSSNLYITDDGKFILGGYFRFKMKGKFAQFTEIFKNNFISITVILTLIISVYALIQK